jgi:hypothetical protein
VFGFCALWCSVEHRRIINNDNKNSFLKIEFAAVAADVLVLFAKKSTFVHLLLCQCLEDCNNSLLLTSVSIVFCFISPSILLPFLSTFHGFLISQQKLAIFWAAENGLGSRQTTSDRSTEKSTGLTGCFWSISRHSLSTQRLCFLLSCFAFLSSPYCTQPHDAPLTFFLSRLPRAFYAHPALP